MKPTIEYDNDTGGLGSAWFEEWWTVTYGARVFKCDSEQDAHWLAHLIETNAPKSE